MTQRCFIALEPPEPAAKCLREALRAFSHNPQVKWVPPENLHLTMLFLGDTDTGLIPEIASILQSRADEFSAPKLALCGLELFPSRNPRIVWASLQGGDDAVFRLHKALLKDIRAIGCAPDAKALKLHITLGRIKSSMPVVLEGQILQSPVDNGYFHYTRLSLYRSVLRPEGPTYHILQQFELNTRR